jgi:signal transduction histidine kinase
MKAPAQHTPLSEVQRTAPRRRGPGLSVKLLVLTVAFVMLAEVLIFVPSVANFRRNWLSDKIAAAGTAALVIEAAPDGMVPPELGERLLSAVGASAIVVLAGEARRVIAAVPVKHEADVVVDLRQQTWRSLIAGAFGTLAAPGGRTICLLGPGMNGDIVEVILAEAPLQQAMWRFAGNILVLSLVISAITAGLVFLALSLLIVRPVRRLAANMAAFEADPENPIRIVRPGTRTDEIGVAEHALAGMEASLARELRQNRHLAALGLAVAKISHDLRNILSTAQIISDRLAMSPDPTVQRFAPKLFEALDRAIGLCESTLSYGRASEAPPRRVRFDLAELAGEVRELIALEGPDAPDVSNCVPAGLSIEADRDQLFRALMNLTRNAAEALEREVGDRLGLIEIDARREGGATVIEVRDNGPGVPAAVRARLFEPFSATTRSNGAGLGLAIAAELVRGHGGEIALLEVPRGALFRIVLPDSPPGS